MGAAAAAGEFRFAIGCEKAEGGVFKASVEVVADDFLGFFALVGVDADGDEIAAGFDDFFVAELTVLRGGVTGSKDARDAAALGGHRHKEDGLVGAFGFGEAVFQNGIPGDAGCSQFGI